ncbi:MAG: Aldehyde dehydrogenase in hypothetical Actinobacterial gene cluster, partial [uncultured Rubrobacteraceae bacterium]
AGDPEPRHRRGRRENRPRHRRRRRRRGRPREEGVPEVARRRARRPLPPPAPPRRRFGGREGEPGPTRIQRYRQTHKRRPRRDGDGGRHLPLLRRDAREAARRHHPGLGGRGHDVPGTARRGRPDRAVELPAHHRELEDGPGPRRRQHGGAQARRAYAANGARVREDREGSRHTRGRGERPGRPRQRGGAEARRARRRGEGRVHGLDGGGARDHGRRLRHHQARHPGARRQISQRRLRRRRPRKGRGIRPDGRIRQRGSGLLRPLPHPRAKRRLRRVPGSDEAGRGGAARRRPARRGHGDGAAHKRRPPRAGRFVRAGGGPRGDPGPLPRRRRLLVPADRAGAGLQRRQGGPGGDLRPRGSRDPVRGRGRRRPPGERHALRPLRLRLDGERRQGPARRPPRRDGRPLHKLQHLRPGRHPVRGLQAVRRRPGARPPRPRPLHRGKERLHLDGGEL